MKITFTCEGHENIQAKHRNTLEFTKDEHVTLRGDCIVGVSADFDSQEILEFAARHDSAKITITAGKEKEIVRFEINKDFNDTQEIVLRRGWFNSPRTLGIGTDRACVDFSQKFRENLKSGTIKVELEDEDTKKI